MANKPTKIKRSLGFVKFKVSIESEIRVFWHLMACQEYTKRWWGSFEEHPARLTEYPGDKKNPFMSIDLTVNQFLLNIPVSQAYIRENALVSFITAFEYYLFETLERLIFVDPSLIEDSSMPIQAKELAQLAGDDVQRWLANKIADKYLRNKSHKEMISRLDTFSKAGVSASFATEIEEWNRWSLVRNAIVHTSRFVTGDLAYAWPARFSHAGHGLAIQDKEVARVHHLAITLANAIDRRAVESVIKGRDVDVLVKELFVQHGMEKPTDIRREVDRILHSSIPPTRVEQLISQQKKGTFPDRWSVSHADLAKIRAQ